MFCTDWRIMLCVTSKKTYMIFTIADSYLILWNVFVFVVVNKMGMYAYIYTYVYMYAYVFIYTYITYIWTS